MEIQPGTSFEERDQFLRRSEESIVKLTIELNNERAACKVTAEQIEELEREKERLKQQKEHKLSILKMQEKQIKLLDDNIKRTDQSTDAHKLAISLFKDLDRCKMKLNELEEKETSKLLQKYETIYAEAQKLAEHNPLVAKLRKKESKSMKLDTELKKLEQRKTMRSTQWQMLQQKIIELAGKWKAYRKAVQAIPALEKRKQQLLVIKENQMESASDPPVSNENYISNPPLPSLDINDQSLFDTSTFVDLNESCEMDLSTSFLERANSLMMSIENQDDTNDRKGKPV